MPKVTLPFNGTVSANGELTLVSKRLTFDYWIRKLIVSFALGTNRTLQVKFFKSNDPSAPSSGEPTGIDLLSMYGEDSHLVGDDERKEFPHEIQVSERGSYIKIYGNNTDSFDHVLDAQVIIEYDNER